MKKSNKLNLILVALISMVLLNGCIPKRWFKADHHAPIKHIVHPH